MLSADSSVNKWKPAIRITILLLICSVATLVRIFSVIRYESIIHEFDPWFNFRATKFLVNNNFKEFWNFFDSESWYPLGRNVGATVYPGLMVLLHSYSQQADSSISSFTNLPSLLIFEIFASSLHPSSPVLLPSLPISSPPKLRRNTELVYLLLFLLDLLQVICRDQLLVHTITKEFPSLLWYSPSMCS